MKLILIHGRAQAGKDPIALKKEWINALNIGLAKHNLSLPITEENIFLPFYGDKLDELVINSGNIIEDIIEKGTGTDNREAKFVKDFILEIAENSTITEAEIAGQQSEVIIDKGLENWAWVQAILRAIDRKANWGLWALEKYINDVFLYLSNSNIKGEINKIVREDIDNEPCVVVGHSLGSIVGYNILRDIPDLKICKYITVGSPLGLKSVKSYLKTPIKMPECVSKGWFNAYDDRDVVALNPLDKNYFNINPSIINKNDVNNQTENRHGIEGYLNDEAVAKEIHKALTEGC